MACALDPNENLAKAEWRIREAAAQRRPDRLPPGAVPLAVLLPRGERRLFDLAEPIPGPTTECLGALARELGMVIVGSLFERRAAGLYHNTAVVIDADGELAGHLPQDAHPRRPALLREVLLHARRPRVSAASTRVSAASAPLVCWDQWYPEAARLAALRGAQVLFYPTAIGWHPAEKAAARRGPARRLAHHPARPRHRQRRLRRRRQPRGLRRAAAKAASSSGAARSSPTRSGRCSRRPPHDAKRSWWWSAIPRRMEEVRRNWPFLRDRRVDAYGPILERWLE